ncbi:cyclic lactone autoinducer peptide [Natranaerovirga pectinivora]|uniref:Cyclic lactone autoinducer peptide n=1 Tax=Natranaerovirga pectinivora TaxID=682400 RepID=A0A4R3ML72_9FIRM|nr:cyclic lactone autoinducer peptide [Natranaerovirga pectinivora]TCT15446.1 cyclic lactone autoinducer peptide [Natranaerovirga pectinivora]
MYEYKKKLFTKKLLIGIAGFFIILANALSNLPCMFLYGETKCPKSLLK